MSPIRFPSKRSISDSSLPTAEEIAEMMVDAFVTDLCAAMHRPKPAVDPSLLEFLHGYHWPGNVRQLRNALESMVVMSKGDVLTTADLPSHIGADQPPGTSSPPSATTANLEQMEKAAVLDALERSSGNRTHAATALGISVRTLQRKLKSWGLATRDDGEE